MTPLRTGIGNGSACGATVTGLSKLVGVQEVSTSAAAAAALAKIARRNFATILLPIMDCVGRCRGGARRFHLCCRRTARPECLAIGRVMRQPLLQLFGHPVEGAIE